MNVVYCFDKKYVELAIKSINSLLANKSEKDIINLYLIVTPDVEKNIKFCKEVNLVYIEYTPDKNLYISGHITGMAYTRLFIAELIPQIDRCIYLDCDTIIYKSLKELWEIDVNDYFYGAKINKHFIFSGILLINLEQIRKHEYIKKYKEYILNHKIIEFHDCTILNEFHRNNTKKITNKYNDRFLNKETVIHHTHEYNNVLNFNVIKRQYEYLSSKSIRNR